MLQLNATTLALLTVLGSGTALSQTTSADSSSHDWFRQTALSPDGKQALFVHQGDIYIMDAKGGAARPLTTHAAYDGYPVWSKDGNQIAFASDRFGNFDIFVMPASGGEAKRLTFHSANDIPSDFSADGKQVIFTSLRTDSAQSAQFPYGGLPETYQVNVNGGTPSQLDTIAMEKARYNQQGSKLLYQDVKGYEDPARKKHTSSITRDIWLWDGKKREKITQFAGEDRNPLWANNDTGFYYLSEQNGSFNVWYHDLAIGKANQITQHHTHPVRDLSSDAQGNLLYSYHGDLYYVAKGQQPSRLAVTIAVDGNNNDLNTSASGSDATEFALSPNGKELAFIVRGDVYVTAVEYGTTVRLTKTAEQERNVSFSPDGRTVIYAGERGGSWNLYSTSLTNKDDKYFFAGSAFAEKTVFANNEETFQPAYSPDGKEIAFLADRAAIKVLNIASGKVRTVLDKKYNYSYSDGDQYFIWSPDSKWLATHYLAYQRWNSDIGLIAADGKSDPINLSQSGYADSNPFFAMNGNAVLWYSAKYGRRNHGSWGSESNVLGAFLNRDSFEQFSMDKEEYALYKEQKDDAEKKAKAAKKDDDKADDKATDKADDVTAVKVDLKYLEDRTKRLTQHSSDLGAAYLTDDGRTLYYLAKFEKGYDLWKQDFDEGSTSLVVKLGADNVDMKVDKDGKFAFILANGALSKVELSNGKKTGIGYKAQLQYSQAAERDYLFEHVWRQTKEKFYVTDLHGVNWDAMKTAYQQKLAGIGNNRDFAELLSELLGELNASHTGARYRPKPHGDVTASLGIFTDSSYNGPGLKISEVLARGPLDHSENKVKAGMVITAIDGVTLTEQTNAYSLLNQKAGQRLRITVQDGKKQFEQVLKPISGREEMALRYQRWVDQRRALVDKLSNGRLGYVHVAGMNTASFQTVYSEVLGKNADKEALIVDTRFNGGGWLHDDLNTLLSGKKYFDFLPRGQNIGAEPLAKWNKPSVVMVSEGNYSDAYLFPYSYQQLKIGKVIGMPVAATGTAVWWETQFTGDLVFGIPQVGMLDAKGQLQENRDLIPDVQVNNEPDALAKGEDQQLAKAVKVLLADLKK